MSTTWTVPHTYTARQLVYAICHARTHPSDRYLIQGHEAMTAAQYLRWFLSCLHTKINSKDPRTPTGRKATSQYQSDLRHDAGVISDHARRAYRSGCNLLNTPELQHRYPHINTRRIIDL